MNIFQKAYHKDLEKVYKSFSKTGGEVILDNIIGDVPDLQTYFENLKKEITPKTRVLISYHNSSWEPILSLASSLGLRKKVGQQNWITKEDLENILNISGFEVVSYQKRFFGITAITIAKPKQEVGLKIKDYRMGTKNKSQKSPINNQYSVSIIIPARNEEGNIGKIISSIPKFGKWQEIIFVEGGSSDNTWNKILQITNNKDQISIKLQTTKFKRTIKAFKQIGKGKADAVRLGFEKARGDILMIYDADMTVPASDLPKFYNALKNNFGDFANGSRLVYPMEKQAMQRLNKIGNEFFSLAFTKILGQHFKDTLCGTKVIWRRDYLKMKKDYLNYLKIDPFGDFALIFSAIKHNLKIVEIPVRYKEREYGSTNIRRFRHGFILLKLAWIGYKEFKI